MQDRVAHSATGNLLQACGAGARNFVVVLISVVSLLDSVNCDMVFLSAHM
jgi:hypothetical protein